MSNQPQPNFGFPGGFCSCYAPGTNTPYPAFGTWHLLYPPPNIIPQQQCQNFSNQASQGMGNYQNPGAGYLPPGNSLQVGYCNPIPPQPQITSVYQPQQQPQNTLENLPTSSQAGVMSQNSQKYRNFVSEPIGEKTVNELAGVGDVISKKLEAKGFTRAYVVLGQFLVLKKDEEQFVNWMKDISGANARQASDCYQCLSDWCDQFL